MSIGCRCAGELAFPHHHEAGAVREYKVLIPSLEKPFRRLFFMCRGNPYNLTSRTAGNHSPPSLRFRQSQAHSNGRQGFIFDKVGSNQGSALFHPMVPSRFGRLMKRVPAIRHRHSTGAVHEHQLHVLGGDYTKNHRDRPQNGRRRTPQRRRRPDKAGRLSERV